MRLFHFLVFQLHKCADDAETGVRRLNDVVDIAECCRIVWIAEELVIFFFLLFLNFCPFCRVTFRLEFLRIEDFYSSVGTHYSDVGAWPGVVYISSQLLAAHYDMRSAVAFAKCDGDFRNRRLAVGIEKFRSVGDDAAILLLGAAEKSRHVHKADNRDVEGVAESDKTGSLAGSVDVQNAR